MNNNEKAESEEWRAKYEETSAFYFDLLKQHNTMRKRLEECETVVRQIKEIITRYEPTN